jgi:hypothetical protein
MARNRVIYQSQALFISPSSTGIQVSGINLTGITSSGILSNAPLLTSSFTEADNNKGGLSGLVGGVSLLKKLDRIQSCNFNMSINRQDINEFGKLARLDSIVLESPTVGLDFNYYATDGFNERLLGFNITGVGDNANTSNVAQSISGLLSDIQGNNYYILTVDEGEDVVGGTLTPSANVVGIGNGFITEYSFEASVGSIPTVSVTVEAFNIKSDLNQVAIQTYPTGGVVNNTMPFSQYPYIYNSGTTNPQFATTAGSTGLTISAATFTRAVNDPIYIQTNDASFSSYAPYYIVNQDSANLAVSTYLSGPAIAATSTQIASASRYLNTGNFSLIPGTITGYLSGTATCFTGTSPAIITNTSPATKRSEVPFAYKIDYARTNTAIGTNVITTNNPFAGASNLSGLWSSTAGDGLFNTGNSSVTALRPGDIVLTIPASDGMALVTGEGKAHIQSFSFTLPLSRTVLQRLGNTFGFARVVNVPINMDISISAIVSELKSFNLFDDLLASDKRTLVIQMKDSSSNPKMTYTIKGAILQSETYSENLGDNQTVDLTYNVQCGGANDTENGLFMSGSASFTNDLVVQNFYKLGSNKVN